MKWLFVKRLSGFVLALCMVVGLFAALPVPTSAAGISTETISAGSSYSMIIKEDRSLWATGHNEMGQLGIGKSTPSGSLDLRDLRVEYVKVMSDVVSVTAAKSKSTSSDSTFAIKTDGSLWGWGDNYDGQLGIGTSGGSGTQHPSIQFDEGIDQDTPVKIMDDVIAVSAGWGQAYAIKSDHSLWAWGTGRLNDGEYKTETKPIKIMDDVTKVSTFFAHTLVVKTDGSLWGWGRNVEGEIGIESLEIGVGSNVDNPVKIMDNVIEAYAGPYSSLAIKSDGSLWAWGEDPIFYKDDTTWSGSKTPVKILDNVKTVSTSDGFTLAVKHDGSLWAWGSNDVGNLGDGTQLITRTSPVKVMDGVAYASAGWSHSIAVKTDGTLWAWGQGGSGQLGNGKRAWGAEANYTLVPIKITDGVKLPTAAQQPVTPPTSDAPSSWATEQVNAAIAAGLVPENLQKNYTSPVSRGSVAQMFISLVEKTAGQPIDDYLAAKGVAINSSAFSDTTDKAVLAANALGLINGVGGGRFDLEGTLTRAQIAAIINRYAILFGVNTSGYEHGFTDVGSHWVSSELGWPVHAGIVNGVGGGKYDPEGKLTTEQAIAITYRALKADKTNPPVEEKPAGGTTSEEFLSSAIYSEVEEYATLLDYLFIGGYNGTTDGSKQMTMWATASEQCDFVSLALFPGNDYWSGSAYIKGQVAPKEEKKLYNMDEFKAFLDKYANY